MVAKPAARILAPTQHAPLVGAGTPTVLVNSLPAWTVGLTSVCPVHGPEVVGMGSETVKLNGMSAARKGDFLQGAGPPNQIMVGSPNVRIGTPEIGIARRENREAFCLAYCALARDWPNLTPEERRARYTALLASSFATFGAPPPGVDDSAAPAAIAAWDSAAWQVQVGAGAFEHDTPPPGPATFHEIRHAEQTFMALRATGGAGLDTTPESVRHAAAAQPLDPDSPEGRFGALHADNELDPVGLDNRSAIIREINDAYAEDGLSSQRYADAVQAYRDQPGGADAWDVEHYGNCNC